MSGHSSAGGVRPGGPGKAERQLVSLLAPLSGRRFGAGRLARRWGPGDASLTDAAFTGTGGAGACRADRDPRPGGPDAGARPGVQTRPTSKVNQTDPDA